MIKFCLLYTSFFIGGDHSVTIPLLRAAARVFKAPLGVIHLDAHPDLCQELSGNRLSHGCTHRRALESPFIELQNLYFIGIRSFELDELEFLKDREANIYTAGTLFNRGIRHVAGEICRRLSPVSYTHLDVYKRQELKRGFPASERRDWSGPPRRKPGPRSAP